MKKLASTLMLFALVAGALALATPTPAVPREPKCGKAHFCGYPGPDDCTGPCEYWEVCSKKDCGCKTIPGCVP